MFWLEGWLLIVLLLSHRVVVSIVLFYWVGWIVPGIW